MLGGNYIKNNIHLIEPLIGICAVWSLLVFFLYFGLENTGSYFSTADKNLSGGEASIVFAFASIAFGWFAYRRRQECSQETRGRKKAKRRFTHEIGERERAEGAMQEADERLKSLSASIPGVVYQRQVTTGGDISYTYISEGAKDLFGVSAEEILANPKALFDCHGPEYRAKFRERLLAASKELTMWDVEAQIITRDGEEKWTHAIARPHQKPDGTVLWDGVILDSTWIKKAEIELRRSKEAAETANRAKSEFLAAMSHELRTPLNAIIGFSEIMMGQSKQPAESTKFSEYASDINDAGQDLLYLINNILDFSSIEAGKDELREGYFEIRGLARSVFSLVDEHASNGGITLEPELANDLPLLFADESKLKKILVILVSNAIKFSEPGGTVTLKVWSTADSGYVFQVIDTGIGIALKDIPKALSRFSQVDGDLDRKYGGAGLGLPLAKALVEVQGGSMDLQSKLGVGTTVTVRFPFLRVKKALHDAESPDIENRRAS